MNRRERRRAMRVPADHGWKAREGYQIVVADRGAVRFDVPREWQVERGDDCDLVATDRPPPDDDCRLKMSLLPMRLPPEVEGPPLLEMMGWISDPQDLEVTAIFEPVIEPCAGAELAWSELHYVEDGRDAISRTVVARGGGLHVVFTLALWSDQRERFEPAWTELRRSIEVAKSYDLSGRDPRRN